MAAHRVLTLVNLAVVLLAAWYAGQQKLGMGIAVAIVGLVANYSFPLLAIPAAIGMAAAAMYVSGVVAVVVLACVVILLAGGPGPGGKARPNPHL